LKRHTGLDVTLIEASTFDDFRVGETVSSGIDALLRYLGASSVLEGGCAMEAFGSEAAWGSDQLIARESIFSGGGQGLHLDRVRFDKGLAMCAADAGATLMLGHSVRETVLEATGWRIDGRAPSGEPLTLGARLIVDATGRYARIARRLGAERVVRDRLVGISCQFATEGVSGDLTTLVETIPEGWWYTAPLPGRRHVVTLMTDADLVRSLTVADRAGFLDRLQSTRHVAVRLSEARCMSDPVVHPAETHVLSPPIGRGWIAAGDAASAFDPLSSLGIGHAVSSGIQAARIASELFAGGATLANAYAADIMRHRAQFEQQSLRLYAGETRWPDAPFWARRRH
jgi:flavin-dependent dehydrogenase